MPPNSQLLPTPLYGYVALCTCRHPDASCRPQPRDLLLALVRDVAELMEVPVEDVPAGSQAAVLGAPLNAASQLYTQLQNMYTSTSPF